MAKWRSYHNAYNQKNEKENQRFPPGSPVFRRASPHSRTRHVENRRSYHDLLKDEPNKPEPRVRRLSDPLDEPERQSVQEVVSKLQKQHTVQELLSKIQKKTGLIHKSAQKWKENKEKKYSEGKKESSEGENDKPSHNYENIRQWDVPQEKLSQLPYRCRNTVYSPSGNCNPYDGQEYQRNPNPRRPNLEPQYNRNYEYDRNVYQSQQEYLRNGYGSAADMGNDLYDYSRYHGDEIRVDVDPRKLRGVQSHHNYSPTQNDSGYSTKPYGGSSTGPSLSLSGQDFESGSTEIKPPPLPLPMHKRMEGATSSLV